MSDYTPGPWTYEPRGEVGDTGMTSWVVLAGEDNAAAFWCVEGENDVRLIVAAPEMAALLEELVEGFHSTLNSDEQKFDIAQQMSIWAEEILTRVKGES